MIFGWLYFVIILNLTDCLRTPHIVFFMVDDLGWNDVSFHGSDQIMTPNIDAFAYQGAILQQYYSEAVCTPARTALLTGTYPMRLGMHGLPLYNAEDRGIPLTQRLLPSFLKEMGYSTHLVGKWHVGMSREEYLPTFRGYDSHYGMRGGFIDYYTYNKVEGWPDGKEYVGLDLFDGMEPQINEERYIVDALTDRAVQIIANHNNSKPLFLHVTHNAPHAGNDASALQPPPYTSSKNRHIAHSDRRLFADMVTHLDNSFGRLISALNEKRILHDTLIVFLSDNGAPTVGTFRNWGLNLPLRGQKFTPWEGGVRVPAFIWHSSIRPKVWEGLMHITDWLPTLIAAAGGVTANPLDGINQWDAIINGEESRRKEVLVSIDNIRGYGSYRFGDYKIILGNVSGIPYNGYLGEEFMQLRSNPPSYINELFNCNAFKILRGLGYEFDNEEVIKIREAASLRQLDLRPDSQPCIPTMAKGCLYNVRRDPAETHDLWDVAQPIASLLIARLDLLWNQQQPRAPSVRDERGDPSRNNYIWKSWLSEDTGIVEIHKNDLDPNDGRIARSEAKCGSNPSLQNILCILRSVF